MKDIITKILKKVLKKVLTKVLTASINEGSTIQAINARVVSIIRYGAGIVEWRKNELDAMITNHVQKLAPKGRCRQVVLKEE